jgi:two-component system, LytTR family, sensor kinase
LLCHYIAWEVLYFLTLIPYNLQYFSIVRLSNIVYEYGVLGTIDFILFYMMAAAIIPYFFRRKKWIILTITCIAANVLFAYIKYIAFLLYREYNHAHFSIKNPKIIQLKRSVDVPHFRLQPYNLAPIFAVILIAFAYYLLKQWYFQENLRKTLENQKLKAELAVLKLQINPHFLFNALNSIYSLSVLEKSPKTGDGILILSNLMRYMLYEKEDEAHLVELDMEINHINNFIDLEKLRHAEGVYIQFSIEGDIALKKVPLLLFFPLIENASKHGILNDPKKPISIQISVTDKIMSFRIHNFKNNYVKSNVGGIGLNNVRQRIMLLFPENHKFNIRETEKEFAVELEFPFFKNIKN